MDDNVHTRQQSGYGVASFVLASFLLFGNLFAGLLSNIGITSLLPGVLFYKYVFSIMTFYVLGGIISLFGVLLGVIAIRQQGRKRGISYVAVVINLCLIFFDVFELFT